jgi:hypothetical protein
MGKDAPFDFDEEIKIGGETYRRPIRTLFINALDIYLGNLVSIIGERWGAFVNENTEPPQANLRQALHCSGISNDRLCVIGSNPTPGNPRGHRAHPHGHRVCPRHGPR